ncbi:MAG: YbaB/EbfC family nucleoid-associated protein [Bacteroidia bacterium]|nr:YbaB/EbfC family nucleoid-associated protein [Bacteroidia bacterium]
MFGKLGEAKQKAEEMKLKLDAITVEGNVQGIKVTANANKKITAISISPELLIPENKEQIEDLLLVAIENAMNQAENISAAEMKAMMGVMMPGLGNLFGN